ncbi:MAG: type II toxin-antitoxin system VapC family toxin [Atopobiaceae bacterium]|nr:type II toxin-antitoxin system VapC family toxin [Atopobiaceae bacterium]
MRLLLDTHILIWALSDDPKLPDQARRLIEDRSNQILFSSAALWEIEIEHAAHPDRMLCDAAQISSYAQQSGYQCLQIAERHVLALASLVYKADAKPHNDPFDRIMICQAKTDGLVFLTHDSLIPNYGEPCVQWV